MPCKGVTWPDNAILSPAMARWISNIQVLPPGDFDTHQVVLFDLQVPAQDLYVFHLPLPRTWLDLEIASEHLPEAYSLAVQKLGIPDSLAARGETVECAVDLAYRKTRLVAGIHPLRVKPLPKTQRGRCKPRRPERAQRVFLTKQARPGDYAYNDEIIRRSTQAKVKQVRRTQALYGRMKATGNNPEFSKWHELQNEWFAILRSNAFGRGLQGGAKKHLNWDPLHCPCRRLITSIPCCSYLGMKLMQKLPLTKESTCRKSSTRDI